MGVTYVLSLNSKPVVTYIEEEAMSPLVFYYCICAFLCHCYLQFNPSLRCFLPFLLLSCDALSRPGCHLSEFYPSRAS